ncbi:DUF2147 domain-containing protein [Parasphingorhabdus sp.]|uniref:DUF2147 domain-containing protein n=1 Tax=Parasphingorhabdus sp. TaxID=2709688 RepID=UPI002F92A576
MFMTNVRKCMTLELRSSSNTQFNMQDLHLLKSRRITRSFGSTIKSIVFAAICALLLSPAAAASSELDPTGFWKTEKRSGVVEIFRCGNAFCGRVVDAAVLRKNPKQTDVKNPDKSLRSRAVRGLVVLKNFTGESDEWSGGPLYDPDTGDSAPSGRLRLRDANTLEVRGCIARFFCRTQVWSRRR